MNSYLRSGSGAEVAAVTAKIGKIENTKAWFLSLGAAAAGGVGPEVSYRSSEWRENRKQTHKQQQQQKPTERNSATPPCGSFIFLHARFLPSPLHRSNRFASVPHVWQNRILHDVACIRVWYVCCWSRFFMISCTQKRCFLLRLLLKRTSITVNNCSRTNKAWASLD